MTRFRCYFDSHRTDQLVWSIDDGHQNTEIQVREIRFVNCSGLTRYIGKQDNPEVPAAWIEVMAERLEIADDVIAVFYGKGEQSIIPCDVYPFPLVRQFPKVDLT